MNKSDPVTAGISVPDVPAELQLYPQWVVWRYENNPKGKKPRKVPYSPITLNRTGTTEKERSTWGSFDDACQAYANNQFSGIGFVFSEQDPFVGIDLDHCAFEAQPDSWAEHIIDKLDSYTEVSPSGTGFHIIVRGQKPGSKCKKPRRSLTKNEAGEFVDDMEMYDKDRYFTVTGKVLDTKVINQDQDKLVDLYHDEFEFAQPAKATKTTATTAGSFAGIPADDSELLKKIAASKQRADFERLWSGDISGNGNDHSSADLALCLMLSFWTGKDAERMDRLFRLSKLIRPKWDEMRGELTYGQRTLDKAVELTTNVYRGTKKNSNINQNPKKDNVVSLPVSRLRTCHITETGFQDDKPLFDETALPWPDLGTYYHISPANGALYMGGAGEKASEIIALRPIWIHSLGNDEHGESYRLIKFYDQDLKEKIACFPSQWFTKTKDTYVWASLMSQGMIMMSGKEKYVSRFLDTMSSHCFVRSWAASKIGWFEAPVDNTEAPTESRPVFVLPDNVLGNTGDNRGVFFQSIQDINSNSISSRGTLKQWQKNIADKASGNYLIMFAIAAGLAGGMTKLSGTSSGGFHFWGLSSCGKTTLVQCAASVWGDGSDPQNNSQKTSIRKWNATASGLEATAQLHNDICLCLDEIGELEPAELSRLIYTLTGGTPKGRSKDTGGLRSQAYWHIMLLSSGEESTEQIMKGIGQNKRGGQTHRLPDIRVDGLENGIVQVETHDPEALVDDLKIKAGRYYGTAGPVLISWLIKEMEEKGTLAFTNEINANIKAMERVLIDGINPLPREIRRVLKRMAAIAVAAMYAGSAGVIQWEPDEISKAVVFVRNLWLSDMGDNISELDKALATFRDNLNTNIANFFDLSDEKARYPLKMMGYKNFDYIMVLPSAMDQCCNNYSKRQLLKELENRNILLLGEENKATGKARPAKKIPAVKFLKERPRCYWISRHFLES